MQKQSKNQKFRNSKNKKRDDLFTPLTDIEYELRHYKKHFFGKVIYCNCDDPRTSNFFRYFFINFRQLGLKKLIASCYKNQTPTLFKNDNFEPALYVEFSGEKNYKGIMGVPLSFLDKYNPLQFEILGNENDMKITKGRGYINGKRMYGRIFIKNKKI